MRLLLTTLLLTCRGSTATTAQDAATSIVKTDTQAGQFYSSQLSLDQGFPFSDIVETNGGLVFISGLVGTDETGELVPGGLEAETHAIFRQMSTYLTRLGLGFDDVVTQTSGVIWEGERSQVDAFEFAGGITVNVINVSDKDWNDKPIETVIGTDGIDLIFGNDSANLIDGGLGDDIIFGGDGDDVIIGGEGDDILLGGDGDDTIRGDTVTAQDAALSYFAELTDFDNSQLSIDNSAMSTGGDDVILGGDGVDDIDSGEGSNLVSSGRLDLNNDGEADLDIVESFMEDNNIDNKDIFDNDDWV
mgnify:CR=1 FL=1